MPHRMCPFTFRTMSAAVRRMPTRARATVMPTVENSPALAEKL